LHHRRLVLPLVYIAVSRLPMVIVLAIF